MPTGISYVDETWNPVIGCEKCSPGCLNCYAEQMAVRLSGIERKRVPFKPKYDRVVDEGKWVGNIICDEKALGIPHHWRNPRRILVSSMSDLFHPKVPFKFINRIFDTIWHCQRHTFLLLTKRIDGAADYFSDSMFNIPLPNVHLGATICIQPEADEILPIALQIPGFDWVSAEPLLGGIDFKFFEGHDVRQKSVITGNPCIANLDTGMIIKRVVVGCESGPKRRPCKLEWIRSIVEQGQAAGTGIHVKQMEINGKVEHDMSNFPAWAQVRDEL